MTIEITKGDLLRQTDADAIVNTVNCVGVMGKGIALQFKNKWPANYKAYKAACQNGEVQIGKMFVFDCGRLVKPHYIINFPTKDHWRAKSKIEFIHSGLIDLIEQVRQLNIKTIALPPLGCGNGGLAWSEVRPLIENAFSVIPEVTVHLFEPDGAPAPQTMEVRTHRPRMTPGRAAILKVLDTYRELGYGLSRIEVQKLAYFLQEAGENLRLRFAKDQFGPYSDQLRHALNTMEGHFIRGVGDGTGNSEIEPLEDALKEADSFVSTQGHTELQDRVSKVEQLIDGFQSPYGMELLSTVHWVASRNDDAPVHTVNEAIAAVHAWSPRKKSLMSREHIEAAWQRLASTGWITARAT
jgi:O-acetyl-ADP-ribose deacetylase (regulator of RNase III)